MRRWDNKRRYRRDYGRWGRIGLVTPQANPTAEPEIQLLMPAGVSLLTTRCTSKASARQRFIDYMENLSLHLRSFDELKLDAVGFACTASTYLLGREYELSHCDALSERFAYPVVTAASALQQALLHLGAQRIALACPYPQWLFEKGVDYWRERGFQVVQAISTHPMMEDTRAIYDVSSLDVMDRLLESFGKLDADVLVVTGTGMPALGILPALQQETGITVINSNLALAWACLQAADIPAENRQPETDFPLLSGWQDQIGTL